jgi:PKD repeat protein
MSTSKNGLDAFERSLRESLDQFEVPYNSADWTQMERTLNGGNRAWLVSGVGLSVLVAGLFVVGGAAWYAANDQSAAKGEPSGEGMAASATVAHDDARTDQRAAMDHAVTIPEQVTTAPEQVTTASEKASVPAAATTKATDVSATKADARKTSLSNTPVSPNNDGGNDNSMTTKAAPAPAASTNEITFRASVAEGCPGTAVEFKVSNMPEDGIYLWNFGDGSFSNHANPEHTFTKPGSYQVMLSMSAAGVGTIQNKPSSDVIVIHEAPMAAFNVLKQEYDGHLPSVHFENRSLAGKQYLWDFGDGQNSTIAHPDHVYKKKGVYQVELTVTNDIGCEDKVMKDVRIDKDYNLDAPASFSPNSDDFQETFMPEALRTLGVKFNLTVYAPNGTLLYQTNDASKPWTGRPHNRGELCGAGEYVWVVDVRESLHLAETYTGKVKLER